MPSRVSRCRTGWTVTLARLAFEGRRALAAGLHIVPAAAIALLACLPPDLGDTVVLASGADLESADPIITIHPMARQVQRHALLVTLLRMDSELRPEPYYARQWRWADDRRELWLELEPELRWHDGHPTTSADVAFTLERVRDPASGSPRAAELSQLVEWSTAGAHEVVLRFSAPQPRMPQWLVDLPIAPEHLLRAVPPGGHRQAAYGASPVGNGPFRFAGRVRGQRWEFERNEDFPASMGGAPALRRVVVAVVDEAATKFAGLVSDELHTAGIAPTMAELVMRDERLDVLTYPVLFSTALVFNSSRPPFDDVRVRRAFSVAVDRGRIVKVAYAGHAIPAGGAVAEDNPLALALSATHDPDSASRLLDEAGWTIRSGGRWRERDGVALSVQLLTVGSQDNAVEQLIQDDLARIGVRLEIRQLEMGAFLAAARATEKGFDLLTTGIPGDLSLSHLASMFDSRLAGGALDYAGYHTDELDEAFDAVRRAQTADALTAAWIDVQRILAHDMPVSWLLHLQGVQGLSGRLRNVEMDLRGELATLSRWTLAERGRSTSK